MTEQELREKLEDSYREFSFWQDRHTRSVQEIEDKFDELVNRDIALIKEAGYVGLAVNQSIDLSKLTVLTDKQVNAIIEKGFPTNTKPESEGHAHRIIQLAHTKRELGAK